MAEIQTIQNFAGQILFFDMQSLNGYGPQTRGCSLGHNLRDYYEWLSERKNYVAWGTRKSLARIIFPKLGLRSGVLPCTGGPFCQLVEYYHWTDQLQFLDRH